MTSSKKNNDTRLLFGVAAAVIAGATAIALLAAMRLEPEADTARDASRPSSRAAAASHTPPTMPASLTPGDDGPGAQLASFEPPAQPGIAAVDPTPDSGETSVEPLLEIDPHENFVVRGLEAWEARDYRRAAAYFDAEVSERPERAWPQYMLGLAAWKSGRLDDAASAMERAAALDPQSIKTAINLSRIRNDRREFEAALEAAAAALAIDESDPEALFLEGRSLANLGRTDEALESLERSLALDETNGYVHNLVGLIRLEQKRTGEALIAFEQAAALLPGVAYVENNLGMALELEGRPDEAVAAYRRAAESDPHHEKARINLARLDPASEPEAAVGEAVASIVPTIDEAAADPIE